MNQPSNRIRVEIPDALKPLFISNKRYIVIYGGRGSGKSWTIAAFLLVKGMESKRRILCCREVQNSIRDSVHKLLADKIEAMCVSAFYEVQRDRIIGRNGTEFIFKGLYHNEQDIKSTEGIDYAWIEEAHSVSRKSLEILTPTIRKENSQIIFSYNPTGEDDPIHADYTKTERDDCLKININYDANPWFPDVLRAEMEYDRRVDPDKYVHKWLGQCVQHSEAQIFYGKWSVQDCTPAAGTTFYYGADWGFSQDPSCAVRAWIKDNHLYIDHEAWGYGVDIDKLPALFSTVPGIKTGTIIADSARPETISYMKRNGFPGMKGSAKGKGSIVDGISFLRSFEKIIISPSCKNIIDEMRLYCYKMDKLTGKPTREPEDKNNHGLDALRYALEDVMRHNQGSINRVIGW